jgi:hypothetical protein
LLVLSMTAAAALVSHGRFWQWPDRHNPWAPLAIDEPPHWLTRHKLRRLDDQPQACLDTLEQAAIQALALPDHEAAPGCPLRNVVRLSRMGVELGSPLTLSCRAAVSLALWERHVLMPAAQRLMGSPLQRLEHLGSFACRPVYGRVGARTSQHASADALDVAGFRLADGRRITVAGHWRTDGGADAQTPEARFLRAAHRGACRFFDGVLGPDHNAAHADHLHVDRGPFRMCR